MDWYGASIISDMQPQTTTQGRIRDTPLEIKFKKFFEVLRKELCPLVAEVLSKNALKLALVSENASSILPYG